MVIQATCLFYSMRTSFYLMFRYKAGVDMGAIAGAGDGLKAVLSSNYVARWPFTVIG
jgi:predicted carbohydrate-binding protein with CBM5 and CBM33 domain